MDIFDPSSSLVFTVDLVFWGHGFIVLELRVPRRWSDSYTHCNIMSVCMQQRTSITPHPPTPHPPFETHASSPEEHHLCNITFVCMQQRTSITPPHPPFETHSSSPEEHHLCNIMFVCMQQRTSITPPPPL